MLIRKNNHIHCVLCENKKNLIKMRVKGNGAVLWICEKCLDENGKDPEPE